MSVSGTSNSLSNFLQSIDNIMAAAVNAMTCPTHEGACIKPLKLQTCWVCGSQKNCVSFIQAGGACPLAIPSCADVSKSRN